MQSTSSGIVIAHRSAAAISTVLLVKTAAGWGLPIGEAGENTAALLARVQAAIFPPSNLVQLCDGKRREFPDAQGELQLEVAVSATDQLRPFIESDEWIEARFCSFEEAFYIIRADQDAALRWCERAVKKALEH